MKKLLPIILSALCLNSIAQVYNAGTHFTVYVDIVPDSVLHYTIYPYTNQRVGFKLFDAALNNIQFFADGSVSPGGTAANISVKSMDQRLSIRFGRYDSTFIPAYSYYDVSKVALPLTMGQRINDPMAIWDTTLLDLTNHKGWGGGTKNDNDFVGGEKYIGLKYQDASTLRYGWIRVQCDSANLCYVKDYSFSSAALSIPEQSATPLKIFPNPVDDVFYLQTENPANFKIEIFDLLGNKINFISETNSNRVQIHLDKNLPEGYYFVRYSSGNNSFTGRFVKLAE